MKENTAAARQSNFELLRIISMMLIVSLHYFEHGFYVPESEPLTANIMFLQSLKFGRIGVDLFVLISGYFLVTQKFRLRKFLKLFFQCAVIHCAFTIVHYIKGEATALNILSSIFSMLTSEHWFVTTYAVMYLLSDYINLVINNLNRRQHLALAVLLIAISSALPTFLGLRMCSSSLFFFISLYVSAAYVRLYSPKLLESKHCLTLGIFLLVILDIARLAFIWFGQEHAVLLKIANRMTVKEDFFMVVCAMLIFAGFKNLKIKYSPFINTVAASSLGAYIVDGGRFNYHLFFTDILHTQEYLYSPYIFVHAPFAILFYYTAATLVHMLYRFTLEPKIMACVDRCGGQVLGAASKVE